ncbi:MAG: hypothetical protein IJX53_01760 [Clostridia bacterium]|nr:hypothetical protein [Clostridia bacterium]
MDILEKLFREYPAICARSSRPGSEYRRLAEQLDAEYEQFRRELSDEGMEHFKALEDIKLSMATIDAEDCFAKGFRLGAKIMLAVTGDRVGQFQVKQ